MPTIEIMSPMSDTCWPATLIVEGEHDLAKVAKDAKSIKVEYRLVGSTGGWSSGCTATPRDDGTWNCTVTLPSGELGHNYDIRATLYDGAMAQEDVRDFSFNIQVTGTPGIIIMPPPMMPLRAGDKLLTGKSDPRITGTIFCTIFRVSAKRKQIRPVAFYNDCGRGPDSGDWFVNPPPAVLHKPSGNAEGKTFVIIASIVGTDGRVKAFTSTVLRRP